MALVRWIPYKDLLFLQERMSRIFDQALSRYAGDEDGSKCSWSPAADIYETDDNIVLKVELAGIEKGDVNIEVRDNVLILKGNRSLEQSESDEHYHMMECSYGTFQRVFTLPGVIKKSSIKTEVKDGVLEITVPKTKERKASKKKVKVK